MWAARTSVVILAASCSWLGAGTCEALADLKRSDSIIKASVTADKPGADGRQVATVKLKIEDGWWTYANPVGLDDLADAAVKVWFDGKGADEVQVEYPKGEVVRDAVVGDYFIYRGTVAIKVTLKRLPAGGPLTLKAKFRAMRDSGPCLIPVTANLSLP